MDKGEPKKKKLKPTELHSKDKIEEKDTFVSTFAKDSKETFESVLEFNFNKKRVRILSDATDVPEWADGVVYWMFRDERIYDNWALLFAQKLALKNKIALHVCFCRKPNFLDATIRHFKFLLKGLEEVSEQCKKLNIEFHLLIGNGEEILPAFVEKNKIGAVLVDFMPLREPLSWSEQLKKTLPKEVPLCQVDAHNIVPTWIASDKLEYGARTIRGKITRLLPEFLTEFPPVIRHPYSGKLKAKSIDWLTVDKTLQVDRSVDIVEGLASGYTAGMKTLAEFCNKRIKLFASKRNDPLGNALSGLSPYFHFGQISVQRAILSVKELRSSAKESVDAFIEEAVIRRELADNFCFYNPKYDSIDGTNDWAKKTLNDHRKDKRTHIYSRSELEESKTHDDLWNSAQIQLVKEGKMHGFLRMYWAKKILEWTPSPEEALAIAIYLNDRYSMDGRDPNGFVGCMWSICGIHDQGWKERDVFGKIRYMNYAGCQRKFNVPAFVARYGGKKYTIKEMAKKCDEFFNSLGLPLMNDNFWNNSQFEKPKDRDSTCITTAWDMVANETDLRLKYQGMAPPKPLSDKMLDILDKSHVVSGETYFLSYIIQFQMHQSLCIAADEFDPKNRKLQSLDKCDISGSKKAGGLLKKMLRLGASKPWLTLLKAMTGQNKVDASSILNYYGRLYQWLVNENKKQGNVIGW